MNTKYIPYALLFILLLAFSIYQNFEQGKTIKGLNSRIEIAEQYLEQEQEKNTRLIDSLIKESKKELIDRLSKNNDSLLTVWNKRNTIPKYDKDIDKMRNLDSISKLFNRFYPDPNKP